MIVFQGGASAPLAIPPLAAPLTGSSRWQLDSKSEKVTSLSPDRGTLTNK